MVPRRKHHDLLLWQEGMSLVKDIYKATANFPSQEVYGLTGQMRRAAISIPSNIAEGAARTGNNEFLHFLSITRGSLCELETQVRYWQKIWDILQIMQTCSKRQTKYSPSCLG